MKKFLQNFLCFALIAFMFAGSLPTANACGLYEITPVFQYEHAPESPFQNFAAGKIGIVNPNNRRVVLFASYRYLNGGSFTADEQKHLVDVWQAVFNNKDFNNDDIDAAVKKWIEARKSVVRDEEKLPEIYTERKSGGYEFFSNCTQSSFETATETLKDRALRHGGDDKNVQNWLTGQDAVFALCATGKEKPPEVGADAPAWLQKDRAYQIAAAEFYTLNYDEARRRFEAIAADNESVWQETADYLVARTLVRQASLTEDAAKSDAIHAAALAHLQDLTAKGGKFYNASQKLLNLVKYRIQPAERTRELAVNLTNSTGNQNLNQDLIDYTWLLDKFETQTLEAEDKRKAAEKEKDNPPSSNSNVNANMRMNSNSSVYNSNVAANYNSIVSISKMSSGSAANVSAVSSNNETDFIYLSFTPKQPDGEPDYAKYISLPLKWNAADDEIAGAFETKLGRQLTESERKEILADKVEKLQDREVKLSPSYKYQNSRKQEYEGGYYGSEDLTLSLVPEFLRQDDLTDWLYVYQLSGADIQRYALQKWNATNSDLWLMTALAKSEKTSPEIGRLMERAARFDRNSPAFATIAFHEARILIAQNKRAEARKLLDEVLNSTLDLPVSTRNQFTEQRAAVADNFAEFLRFSQRKPFAFCFGYDEECGTVDMIVQQEKAGWEWQEKNSTVSKEEFEREIEERYAEYRKWEGRFLFDYKTVEIFNYHLPLAAFYEATKSPELPDYLQRELVLTTWTRAVLLENADIETKIAPEVVRQYPELEKIFEPYLKAKTAVEKRRAALWILLKVRSLSPFVKSGIGTKPDFDEREISYFYEMLWWCALSDTDYNDDGEEIPKVVPKANFLTAAQAATAAQEQAKLKKVGDAPAFFAEKVFEWAKLAPKDERVPEALFLVNQANGWSKYGCSGDTELKEKAANLLKTKYPKSPWTAKLEDEQ